MPELPEVEVVRRGLASHVTSRRIEKLTVLHPRPVRSHPSGADGMRAALEGRTIDAVRRRGKFLWFALDEDALVLHLGMSGQFRVNAPADDLVRNTRVLFDLDDGRQLRFVDQRMFGGLTLATGGAINPVPHIALDPFDHDFDVVDVADRMRRRNTTVKRALLDQRFVSGIGNIYADESLWRARMHFEHPTTALTRKRAVEVLQHAREVMAEALEQGGTSFDSLYVNINGESGYFARSLDAYGREGQPCRRCSSPMVRRQFANRSSFLCPKCQRLPRGGKR
ncbi:bifunctional DNA-formamidopyrimidine glycosylase/DNA-(apurinic or apyrimidinic site) lyase [Tessaracoccus sp. OS52]|uniref:bifunctional DNA-formamidopyrimidine glycosylase/DNA-(apurinic or apyrimidinic site) lyase n=1 Tax=Tessaracoccus sp. OS52 TaxID=2886691 RepID=UPI001D11E7BB|nr:bifunctional DNA-formamidopyrimidine glycosylase/DNA-(apurinic or apyrimidinic site) lyase [Tessaracoccus sp. OS52]MCC2593255.1 bifunctional DNA-formamidopyrimidine glycosylase/DNA-(apurinic or apyrimidinic site) lyase [Tessaracoccus sp. OS52]